MSSTSTTNDTSLLEFLDKKGTHALNEGKGHTVDNVFKPGNDTFLESDCDEQLIATLNFRQPVKCQKILLTTFNDDRAPKTIKVFVNRPSLDFGDADRDAATQTFVLQNEPVGGEQSDTNKPRHVAYKLSADSKTKQAELELHFVKFQKVTDLTLFVADNIGGADTSVITQLDVLSSEKMAKHVEFVATEAAFDKLLAEANGKTVFIDFTASWCGQKIAPEFQSLSESTTSAIFRKVDVDANKPIAKRFNVTAMPTFMAFKNGAKVAEMRGADADALRKFVADNK